ncbi:MAG: MarR family transcriptional regulator [Bacteroidales bacterium]|nr:MarR family transcriptional regulator [Bacteroidales bacterium]
MSIVMHAGKVFMPEVVSPETMYSLIKEYGIIPFFENPVPGFSVEEHTAPENWFTGEKLGPWDWKIECVQSGDIAYGKFLWGGKAAFATVEVYRELLNWRRAQEKYQPSAEQQKVLDYLAQNGSVSVPEARKLLGVKKSAADALLGKLQQQTRLVTGDIQRVFNGPNLHYSGWQRSSFCAPEALFEAEDFPFFKPVSLRSSLSPEESLAFVTDTVRQHVGEVPEKLLRKLLM